MAFTKPCRGGQHDYDMLVGAGAGIGRRRCSHCGWIQINLGEAELVIVDDSAKVFAARRPSLFSLGGDPHTQATASQKGFGRLSWRR